MLLILLAPLAAIAASAEKPISAGLGISLGKVVDAQALGAEVQQISFLATPSNRTLEEVSLEPGSSQPWRALLTPQLPRPFRQLAYRSYVMLDELHQAMRIVVQIDYIGCEGDVIWLRDTLSKKYETTGELESTTKPAYAQSYRVTFSEKQIDIHCGPNLILDYADYGAIQDWQEKAKIEQMHVARERATIEKRRLVLDRRRSIRFADTFTVGDRFRLLGAFGIAFSQPFAPNSTQQFPVDELFTAVLPVMPTHFEVGELRLMLAPDRSPIMIRGEFRDISFERVAHALRAKYGSAIKSSNRHVVHKVSGNHAILKRLDSTRIELAFIDATAQKAHRQRLWEQESEGI